MIATAKIVSQWLKRETGVSLTTAKFDEKCPEDWLWQLLNGFIFFLNWVYFVRVIQWENVSLSSNDNLESKEKWRSIFYRDISYLMEVWRKLWLDSSVKDATGIVFEWNHVENVKLRVINGWK